MHYFVTGATGFIGRRLVQALLARRGSVVHVLVRPGSAARLAELRSFCGADRGAKARRLVPVEGDVTVKRLGLAATALRALKGRIDAVYHLAAVYDLAADAASQQRVNVEGTRHVIAFAQAIGAGHLHHVSSTAVAGRFAGTFHEDMFDEATGLDHPYLRTKHAAERLVRTDCRVPWTVYRPSIVVGDSATGAMDKVDGPAHFFKLIQRLRQIVPSWLPAPGLEGGRLNIVPVDFVVRALVHLSHGPHALPGRCFHLVDPQDHRVGAVFDIFARAAHAPAMRLRVNAGMLDTVPPALQQALLGLAPVRRARDALLHDLGLPADILGFLNLPTRYDSRATQAALHGSGITCPPLQDYAWRLWDFWERHLDPELAIDRSLEGAVAGKVALVTGGSSGIGLATACRLAEAGAITIVCARRADGLAAAAAQIQDHVAAAGRPPAQVETHAVDLADLDACDALVHTLLARHGGVDLLVNNAGRSIRRSVEHSQDRFHDLERTMQLNYFAALRLTTGLLPAMQARGGGHVVNISSIGVLTNAPRFSAYVASKAALDAWTRCAAAEFADRGIHFSTVHMPLVRTPMVAPTRLYAQLPMLSPEEAAELVVQACIARPVRVATPLGTAGLLLHAVAPGLAQKLMHTAFRMFSDSEAAIGRSGKAGKGGTAERAGRSGKPALTPEAAALQQLLRGIHF